MSVCHRPKCTSFLYLSQVVDDWRYVSLVIDRMLFFTYMIVSVIATCSILIKTPIFDLFNQAEYKETVRLERLCRDTVTPYQHECDEWYSKELCQPQWIDVYENQCRDWKNKTDQIALKQLLGL